MLITSGVHARELPPPELVARFVETLMAGYDVDADITSILDRTEVHAILYVNPDGRHVAERRPDLQWRKNLNPGNYGGGGKGCDDGRRRVLRGGHQSQLRLRVGGRERGVGRSLHGRLPRRVGHVGAGDEGGRRVRPLTHSSASLRPLPLPSSPAIL